LLSSGFNGAFAPGGASDTPSSSPWGQKPCELSAGGPIQNPSAIKLLLRGAICILSFLKAALLTFLCDTLVLMEGGVVLFFV
jgi:hypothetical protein